MEIFGRDELNKADTENIVNADSDICKENEVAAEIEVSADTDADRQSENNSTVFIENSEDNSGTQLLSPGFAFFSGAILGAFAFLFIFGPKLLNPTYEDWLLTEWIDLSQHYGGWKLYRASEWNFPIGLCSTSFYPYKASVIYTDSIPLFCLVFKLLSPILPDTFQFFGLYGILCFMLQGGFGGLILRRLNLFSEKWQYVAATVFFVLNVAFVQRMYYHTALASHFLILMAILLFQYRDKFKTHIKRSVLWTLLGMLCISLHVTMYGIVSAMLLGYAVMEVLLEKNDYVKSIAVFAGYIIPYIVCSLGVFWIFGGFYGGINGSSYGLGEYSANLNSLINPLDYSKIICELPHGGGQHEGLAYVGIGCLIMCIVSLPYLTGFFRKLWYEYRESFIAISFTSVLLWFVALSPKVMLGENVLFEEKWPQWILDIWGIFRSSGRFLWPVMYLTIMLFIKAASDNLKKGISVILVLAVILQIYESSGYIGDRQRQYADTKIADFESDKLEAFGLEGYEHLQFMHPYTFGEFYDYDVRDQMVGYTQYALRHNMTVSNFHFSRDDMERLEAQIERCDKLLRRGEADSDTIYVIRLEDFYEENLEEAYKGVEFFYTDHEAIAYVPK